LDMAGIVRRVAHWSGDFEIRVILGVERLAYISASFRARARARPGMTAEEMWATDGRVWRKAN
jgi:hypothetical protein